MPPNVCGLFYKLVVNFLAASDGFRMIARFSLSRLISPPISHPISHWQWVPISGPDGRSRKYEVPGRAES